MLFAAIHLTFDTGSLDSLHCSGCADSPKATKDLSPLGQQFINSIFSGFQIFEIATFVIAFFYV